MPSAAPHCSPTRRTIRSPAARDQVYEALTCPKTLLRFTAAEGAGDHCEMGNRPLYDQRAFDWLDETLAA